MNSSRPRSTAEATRKSRHIPRTQHDNMPISFPAQVSSGMTSPPFALVSGSSSFYPEVGPWIPDTFYSGVDCNHIPALSVAPDDLTIPYWDPMDAGYENDSYSSAASAKSCISPPLAEAEMMHADVPYQSPIDHFGPYPDRWTMPMTPPADFDQELFDINKNDLTGYPLVTEPVQECEFIGVSDLQFSRSLPCSASPCT